MRGLRQLVGPVAASVTVVVGLVAGLGPSGLAAAGAAPAPSIGASASASASASVHCALPLLIDKKPQLDADNKSVILAITECTPPTDGEGYETLYKTCVQVYQPGKGWKIAAEPGKALGTACNNSRSGEYHYGISKRYKSYDHYRILALIKYHGTAHYLHSHIATFHTS